MKKLFCFLMMICAYSLTYAQSLTVKSVNLRPQDARAASHARLDKNGDKCAIIRVGVVGVEDLVFPDAVGEVSRVLSEYVVYVPKGLKELRYETKSGKQVSKIVFDDYDIEISSVASYDVIFESESHLRSAIFSVQPKNAKLLVNGKNVSIDADGMAMVNMPVGKYNYQITANGFESQNGTISLTEDEISTVTDVVLQEILYAVTINVTPEDATVFIDNVPYKKEDRADLHLSAGKHSVRITAADHEDDERVIDVSNNIMPINIALKENKQKIVKHTDERTRTKVNIRDAFYLAAGGDAVFNGDITLAGLKGELSYVHHFGGIFALRSGLGASFLFPIYKSDDFEGKEELKDSLMRLDFEIPIQIGISFPFGKYNKHLFSIFGGGYGRYSSIIKGKDEAEMYRDKLSDDHFEVKEEFFDFGLRASFKLDISNFTIGADLSQSLNGYGFSGAIVLGAKLYTLKK